jgi:hypothetical protein
MHIHSLRFPGVLLSGLVLLGCTGEAEWALTADPKTEAPAGTPATEERGRMTSFQGLSSGLPMNAAPRGIAHLDGTVYLVVNGQLFSLASAAQAWTAVSLPLAATEKVTSVTRVDLSLFITTTEGLLTLEWGDSVAMRRAAAPKGVSALLKKGTELLVATSSGLFVSKDKGATFSLRSSATVFSRPVKALVGAPAAVRIFAAGETGGLYFSDDAGVTWATGLVSGDVQALSAAGAFVLVQTSAGTQRSDNYGNTFHPATVGAQPLGFGFSGTRAFAGTMTGVRISDDGGKVWRDGNEGLPTSAQVSALLVAGPAVVAATSTQVFVAELF